MSPGTEAEPFAVEAFILFESHLSRHGADYEEVAKFGLAKVWAKPERI